jgi:uncharacterized membrane protein
VTRWWQRDRRAEVYNWYTRYSEGTGAIAPKGLILSLIVVCILLFTGWKVWEMMYHHRVGVAGDMTVQNPSSSASTSRHAA